MIINAPASTAQSGRIIAVSNRHRCIASGVACARRLNITRCCFAINGQKTPRAETSKLLHGVASTTSSHGGDNDFVHSKQAAICLRHYFSAHGRAVRQKIKCYERVMRLPIMRRRTLAPLRSGRYRDVMKATILVGDIAKRGDDNLCRGGDSDDALFSSIIGVGGDPAGR